MSDERQRSVRHGDVHHRSDAGYFARTTRAALRQPGHVCSTRHTDHLRRESDQGDGPMSGTVYIHHPYSFDNTGRTTRTDRVDHIRDLIEQLLFTAPGERVNRPEFGSGLMQLVFAPNSRSKSRV